MNWCDQFSHQFTNTGIFVIIVAKQRNCHIGEIKLNWVVGKHTRFQNLSDKTIEEYQEFAEHSETIAFDTYFGFNANFLTVSDHIGTSEPTDF
ncbi:MAG: DnaB-like helicase C-terminal domain-containing protein [Planctomycetaceae bacterium]|jgi:hypothetical protein|nr:DnaB-like helicase C-terminal domain-containing protein [Planctomycetaceae bacterium]